MLDICASSTEVDCIVGLDVTKVGDANPVSVPVVGAATARWQWDSGLVPVFDLQGLDYTPTVDHGTTLRLAVEVVPVPYYFCTFGPYYMLGRQAPDLALLPTYETCDPVPRYFMSLQGIAAYDASVSSNDNAGVGYLDPQLRLSIRLRLSSPFQHAAAHWRNSTFAMSGVPRTIDVDPTVPAYERLTLSVAPFNAVVSAESLSRLTVSAGGTPEDLFDTFSAGFYSSDDGTWSSQNNFWYLVGDRSNPTMTFWYGKGTGVPNGSAYIIESNAESPGMSLGFSEDTRTLTTTLVSGPHLTQSGDINAGYWRIVMEDGYIERFDMSREQVLRNEMVIHDSLGVVTGLTSQGLEGGLVGLSAVGLTYSSHDLSLSPAGTLKSSSLSLAKTAKRVKHGKTWVIKAQVASGRKRPAGTVRFTIIDRNGVQRTYTRPVSRRGVATLRLPGALTKFYPTGRAVVSAKFLSKSGYLGSDAMKNLKVT